MYKKEYKYYQKHGNYGYVIAESTTSKNEVILGTIKKESKAKLVIEALTLLETTKQLENKGVSDV